jgi:hypothetical protein
MGYMKSLKFSCVDLEKEYERGYQAGWDRAEKEASAEINRLVEERQKWRTRMGLKVESNIVAENERLTQMLRTKCGRKGGGEMSNAIPEEEVIRSQEEEIERLGADIERLTRERDEARKVAKWLYPPCRKTDFVGGEDDFIESCVKEWPWLHEKAGGDV